MITECRVRSAERGMRTMAGAKREGIVSRGALCLFRDQQGVL